VYDTCKPYAFVSKCTIPSSKIDVSKIRMCCVERFMFTIPNLPLK
jgi:hypothetical protein